MDESSLLRLAEEALDKRDWPEACRVGHLIGMGNDPDVRPAWGWFAEGVGLRELGKTDGALNLLSRAVDDSPNEALFVLELARTHLRAGNAEPAYDLCSRAVALAPDSPDALRLQAWALISLERASEGLALLEAQGGLGGDQELRNLTAWALIGVAESRLERIDADRVGPTSPQVALEVIALMDRVLSAGDIDGEPRSSAEELRQMAGDALRKRYAGRAAHVVSQLGMCFMAFIVVLLLSKQMALAILGALALFVFLTVRLFQPGWKINQAAAQAFRERSA